MNWEKIRKKREAIASESRRLQNQKKLLNEEERKLKIRRYIQLGELFDKAGISTKEEELDEVLLGALVEVKKLLKSPEQRKNFKEEGQALQRTLNLKYAISFKEPPSQESEKVLKNMNFKWRPAQKEWHGRAKYEDLSKTLDGLKAAIEAVK